MYSRGENLLIGGHCSILKTCVPALRSRTLSQKQRNNKEKNLTYIQTQKRKNPSFNLLPVRGLRLCGTGEKEEGKGEMDPWGEILPTHGPPK